MADATGIVGMGNHDSPDRGNWAVVGERALRDSGNSIVVTIPPTAIKVADLEVGDELEIMADSSTPGEIRIVQKNRGEGASQDG